MRLAILLLVPLSVLALGAEATKADAEKMQGTWQVERFTENGEDGEIPAGLVAVIQDNGFEVKLGDQFAEPKVALKLDSSKTPKAVDFVDGDGRLVLTGIYEIEGDRLRICASTKGQRPEKFASEKNSGVRLLVLKRQAK
jgi:uncharacterized protein (TIGR03067 family)